MQLRSQVGGAGELFSRVNYSLFCLAMRSFKLTALPRNKVGKGANLAAYREENGSTWTGNSCSQILQRYCECWLSGDRMGCTLSIFQQGAVPFRLPRTGREHVVPRVEEAFRTANQVQVVQDTGLEELPV